MRSRLPDWSNGGTYDDNPFYKHMLFLLRYIEIERDSSTNAYLRCIWCGAIGPETNDELLLSDGWVSGVDLRYNKLLAFCCVEHKVKMFELQRWPLQS